MLRPDSACTADGVMRAIGFGRESLGEARRSGIVRPISIGRRVYYLGAELIAWIEQQGKQREPNHETPRDTGTGL